MYICILYIVTYLRRYDIKRMQKNNKYKFQSLYFMHNKKMLEYRGYWNWSAYSRECLGVGKGWSANPREVYVGGKARLVNIQGSVLVLIKSTWDRELICIRVPSEVYVYCIWWCTWMQYTYNRYVWTSLQ